jgi:DNA (cytosine-5)-methyltransferase 1
MKPSEIKVARKRLGLSQQGLAEALRLGPNGERTVRRWEAGDVQITGPASLALELLVRASKGGAKC